MRLMSRRRITAAAVVASAVVLAGCGGAAGSAAPSAGAAGSAGASATSSSPAWRLQTVTAEAAAVTATARPVRFDRDVALIELRLDTHETPLDMSLPGSATLTVGGRQWRPVGWDGSGPGGHHREGTLRFAAAGDASGPVELVIAGLPEPLAFRWQDTR